MTENKPVGIKDVAEYAGVAISTVSNVINGTKAVSDALRERVLRAVEATGYEVNAVARSLKSGYTNALCVIVPSIVSVYFPTALRGMQSAAAAAGYSLRIYETQEDAALEHSYIQLLKSQWVDGIVLGTCADPADEAYFEELAELNVSGKRIPIVGFESSPGGRTDAVVVDNLDASRRMSEYLIASGRRHLAYIAGPLRYEMARQRLAGYRQALEQAGLAYRPEWVVEGDFTPNGGYTCMRRLLDGGGRANRPDAVVCSNDQSAVGAICAIREHGLRIPEDVAVTGFDNSFPGTLVTPSLTTVSVPRERMGAETIELLLRRIQNGFEAPRQVRTLETQLVIRRSTDPSAESRWELNGW